MTFERLRIQRHIMVASYFCALVVLVSCANQPTPHPAQTELQKALENYFAAEMEAYLILDGSHLPDVAVDPLLKRTQESLEVRKTFSHAVADEVEVEWVKVKDYGEDQAIVVALYNYKPFIQDFDTGKRTYELTGSSGAYSRIVEAVLIKSDGVWKVKDLTTQD